MSLDFGTHEGFESHQVEVRVNPRLKTQTPLLALKPIT